MSNTQTPTPEDPQFTPGMYAREFFARKQVLTGLSGAVAMLVVLMTQHSSLIFLLIIAAVTGIFIHINVKALRGYVRRRYITDLLAQGDQDRWYSLEPGILPTQSFWQALRRCGGYGVLMIAIGAIGAPAIIIAASSTLDVINGCALLAASWLYAISNGYERSTHIFSDEELREMLQVAKAQSAVSVISQQRAQ